MLSIIVYLKQIYTASLQQISNTVGKKTKPEHADISMAITL